MCGADGRWNPDPADLVCTSKSTHNIEKEFLMLIYNVSNIKIGPHSQLLVTFHTLYDRKPGEELWLLCD